jgi:hypothetical protein
LLRRDVFMEVAESLGSRGWKLLVEILAHAPRAKVSEVPFTFRSRHLGRTKMNWRVVNSWIRSLAHLRGVRQAAARPADAMSRHEALVLQ